MLYMRTDNATCDTLNAKLAFTDSAFADSVLTSTSPAVYRLLPNSSLGVWETACSNMSSTAFGARLVEKGRSVVPLIWADSTGGPSPLPFSAYEKLLNKSSVYRAQFISSAVAECVRWNWSGLALDLEPIKLTNTDDSAALASLVDDLAYAMHARARKLHVYAGWPWDSKRLDWFNFSLLGASRADQVDVGLTYDHPAQHDDATWVNKLNCLTGGRSANTPSSLFGHPCDQMRVPTHKLGIGLASHFGANYSEAALRTRFDHAALSGASGIHIWVDNFPTAWRSYLRSFLATPASFIPTVQEMDVHSGCTLALSACWRMGVASNASAVDPKGYAIAVTELQRVLSFSGDVPPLQRTELPSLLENISTSFIALGIPAEDVAMRKLVTQHVARAEALIGADALSALASHGDEAHAIYSGLSDSALAGGVPGSTRANVIFLLANTPHGLYHAVQTLRQLLRRACSPMVRYASPLCDDTGALAPSPGNDSYGELACTHIFDYPDLERRSFHFTTWTDKPSGYNASKVIDLAQQMALFKYNSAIVGSGAFFNLTQNGAALHKTSAALREMFIGMVPSLPTGDDGHGALPHEPNLGEAKLVTDEPFLFGGGPPSTAENQHREAAATTSLPLRLPTDTNLFNGKFRDINASTGLPAHWDVRATNGSKCTLINHSWHGAGATFPVPDGRHSVQCVAPYTTSRSGMSVSFTSEWFGVLPNSAYHFTIWAQASDVRGAATYNRPELVVTQRTADDVPPSGALLQVILQNTSAPHAYRGVLITTSNAKDAQLSAYQHGGGGGVWTLYSVAVERLDSALLNVVRAPYATDVSVVRTDTARLPLKLGVDFSILDPITPNVALGSPFDKLAPYQLLRLPNSTVPVNETVLVSYNFLPGQTDTQGHSFPNSFGEPRYYTYMRQHIGAVLAAFPQTDAIMFDHDEVRGINRDGRTLALNLSNAALFARELNTLQAFVHNASAGRARALFWDDMVNPTHNGATIDYQVKNGGSAKLGGSACMPELDRRLELINWWYGDPSVDARSRSFFGDDHKEQPNLYSKLAPGLRWHASPHSKLGNIQEWARAVYNESSVRGVVETSWGGDVSGLEASADYSWNLLHATRPVSKSAFG